LFNEAGGGRGDRDVCDGPDIREYFDCLGDLLDFADKTSCPCLRLLGLGRPLAFFDESQLAFKGAAWLEDSLEIALLVGSDFVAMGFPIALCVIYHLVPVLLIVGEVIGWLFFHSIYAGGIYFAPPTEK